MQLQLRNMARTKSFVTRQHGDWAEGVCKALDRTLVAGEPMTSVLVCTHGYVRLPLAGLCKTWCCPWPGDSGFRHHARETGDYGDQQVWFQI